METKGSLCSPKTNKPYVPGATRSRTWKLVAVSGSSLTSYSPVTHTCLSTCSRRHFAELTGRRNRRDDTTGSSSRKKTQSLNMLPNLRGTGTEPGRWSVPAHQFRVLSRVVVSVGFSPPPPPRVNNSVSFHYGARFFVFGKGSCKNNERVCRRK